MDSRSFRHFSASLNTVLERARRDGRKWLITGGSRGIGLAIARFAADRGDHCDVVARTPGTSSDFLNIAADLGDQAQVERAVRTVADTWGGVDVLVNNAGLHRGGKLERLDQADWDAVLNTNLTAPMRLMRALVPHMPSGSAIVNIGAVVGFRGFPGDAPYGASKAGLAGLTAVLAVELARKGIRVNLVVPGLVPTQMTAGLTDAARDALVMRIPLGRVGTDQEIAEVIWWVAGSTYMTGAVIPTDGGLMCTL
jgi:3-oxoacyl-[acyl-carrier protein] reductase